MDKLDVKKIKADFPILNQKINDEKLIYLDNAATSQMPLVVEKQIEHFTNFDRANVHRGVHTLEIGRAHV